VTEHPAAIPAIPPNPGIIGAAVDIGSGAAYDYPSIIGVELGKAKQIDPPTPQAAAQGAETAVAD